MLRINFDLSILTTKKESHFLGKIPFFVIDQSQFSQLW